MLTSNEVAQRLGVNPSRVRQLAAELGIGTKIGRDWMFTDDDVTTLAARKTKPGPQRLSESLMETAGAFEADGSPGIARELRRIALNHAEKRIASGDDQDDPYQRYRSSQSATDG